MAADNSCLMHIGGGLTRQRSGMRVMHLAEVLRVVSGGDFRRRPARRSPTRDSCAATSRKATHGIRDKRAAVVAEVANWEELREAGQRIKERRCATSTSTC